MSVTPPHSTEIKEDNSINILKDTISITETTATPPVSEYGDDKKVNTTTTTEKEKEKEKITTNKEVEKKEEKEEKEEHNHHHKVEWAPWNVPLKRRLQMAAVLFWISLLFLCLSTFAYCLMFPIFWPLLIAYVTFIYFDKAPEKGGRRFEWARRLPIWRYFADYYPIQLIKVNNS